MWKTLLGGLTLVHGILLALAAIGLFKFWVRTRFWLPKYVHVLAGFGLAIGLWAVASAAEEAPVNKHRPVVRLLVALALPAMVYFFFVFYGGQRVAFDRTVSTLVACPFCRTLIPAQPLNAGDKTAPVHFTEPLCRHCGQRLTSDVP